MKQRRPKSIAGGVLSGSIADNVAAALQFASGGVIPGHGPSVTEQPVATFGSFTFFKPVPRGPKRLVKSRRPL